MARPGKAPTTALSSNRRPTNHRHANRWKSPMPEYPTLDYPTPATPTSISLKVLFPRGTQGLSNLPKDQPGIGETTYETSESFLCTGGVLLPITHLGRVSLIATGGATSSHRTLPNIGWPVQTGSTIHFNNKSHVYPSPDTLINPSTDRIHH